MNTMMAAPPPAQSRSRGTAEADIAHFIAEAEPPDSLVAGGFLDRQDGHYVAQQLRTPQLRRAMKYSVCLATDPDIGHFYQEDEEADADWRRRRARTVRDHCSVCPVRAACAELALREGDTAGIRGGLTPERLKRRLAEERLRLDAAAAEDHRTAQEQQDRIAAAHEVQKLAGQYLGGSVPAGTREKNRRAIAAALQRRDELVAAHRRTAGWTEAA